MDAARDDMQQQLAGADVDEIDRISSLVCDDVVALVLPLLPLDDRARAACVRKAWRAEASVPMLWSELNFDRCAVRITDAKLAALCACAGPALRALRLEVPACEAVTGEGLVAALRDGGCVGVRRLCIDQDDEDPPSLTPALVIQLIVACPHLERTSCLVRCEHFAEAAQAAASLPGPLALLFIRRAVPGLAENVVSGLLLRSVTFLELVLCELTPAEAAMLATALRVNTALTELSLVNCSIGDVGMIALAEALHVNHVLTTFICAGTVGLGFQSMAALGNALRVNSTLNYLDLRCTRIGSDGAAALSEALRVNSTLFSLKLSGNRFGNGGAAALGRALRVNHRLANLDLAKCNIGSVGAVALWEEALRVNATLTSLNLRDNDIGDVGAAAFGEALRGNYTLMSLNLSGNVICVAGAAELGKGLSLNNTLTSLDLGSNVIGVDGAASLGAALLVNSTLTSLNLARNLIHDDGAAALIEALGTNNTLTELDFSDNDIGAANAAALAEALSSGLRARSHGRPS